ncbi:MAG: DNA alkylation repair protein [Bacteroidota bacterium]
MNDIILMVREDLRKNSDEKTRLSSQNYFREKILFHGVKMPVVKRIAREYFREIRVLPKAEILGLCEPLWQSGYLEESIIVCHWTEAIGRLYVESDFTTFERWISSYVNNWATCDTFCNHTVGDFIMKYPAFLENLKAMARSENRWMRRASAVSLIVPARKGLFPDDIRDLATILLTDSDDMVQKGYGWMLKAASQAHQQEIFDFVMANKAVMPRTALRYAIEKMPPDLRTLAMEK